MYGQFLFLTGRLHLLINYFYPVSITGVWFYEESECTRIAQKLEALVKEETERRRPNLVQEKSNVDIMSLLTKAGQEYEQVVKHFIFMVENLHWILIWSFFCCS